MNLFFDTETTGLHPKEGNWREEPHLFPDICTIAWKFDDVAHHYIIHSDKVVVPPEAHHVHGISTAMLRQSPHEFNVVMELFASHAVQCRKVVGFNTYFDTSVVKAATLRNAPMYLNNLDIGLSYPKRVDVMRIAARMFYNRWPSLRKVHRHLFDEEFNAHNALDDVLALERCYKQMVKLGKIDER